MSDYGTPPPPPPGPESGYGQMPQMNQSGAPQAAAVRPPAMDQAVMLMKVGAGISLLGLLLSLFMHGAIRDAVEKSNASLTPAQVDTAVAIGTATGIVFGLLGVGLWLWMASANGKGKSWARIVATVFFAFSLLGLVSTLLQAGPVISKLLTVVSTLLGAYIIFLLYKKESSEFYAASSAPRA